MNQKDREKADKILREKNFSLNSSGDAYINGNGDKAKFSPTGGSIIVNGDRYNTTSGLSNSRHLKD